MVPAHLQGENKGFKGSLSSDKQILHRGNPWLVIEASLTSTTELSYLLGSIVTILRLLIRVGSSAEAP